MSDESEKPYTPEELALIAHAAQTGEVFWPVKWISKDELREMYGQGKSLDVTTGQID